MATDDEFLRATLPVLAGLLVEARSRHFPRR
jgi:hypothetical protein